MSNVIFDSLLDAKENHLCVELSLKEKSGNLVGKIQDIINGYLILESIYRDGLDDGFIVFAVDELYGVHIQTDYCKKMSRLYELKSQKHSIVPNKYDNIILNLLDFSKNNNLITEIDSTSGEDEEGNQGFVSEFNDSHLVLKTIDNYAHIDGTTVLDISSIKVLYCNGVHCRDLKLLYDARFRIN